MSDRNSSSQLESDGFVRPAKPARITTPNPLELTVTESVRISAYAREEHALAEQLLRSGALQAGVDALHRVLESAPEITAPHINLGIALAAQGKFADAEASLQRALQLTPDHPVALNEMGLVYRKTGRLAQARESYERALHVLPVYHYAQRNLAVLCDLFLQDLACAIEQYREYHKAFPDDDRVNMWIAELEARDAAQAPAPTAGD